MADEGVYARLDNAVESVRNLNIGDLDVGELERRIELVRKAQELSAAIRERGCSDYYCNSFKS